MFKFDIKQNILDKSLKDSQDMGKLRGSITDGDGNIAGFIGEYSVHEKLLLSEIKRTKDYDLVYKNFLIDVKTKRTTVNYCNPDFEASISNYNPNQQCDIYIFTRVNIEKRFGWIAGYMTKQEYFSKARFLKKDQIDGSNMFIVKGDCWNLCYRELYDIEDLINKQNEKININYHFPFVFNPTSSVSTTSK